MLKFSLKLNIRYYLKSKFFSKTRILVLENKPIKIINVKIVKDLCNAEGYSSIFSFTITNKLRCSWIQQDICYNLFFGL